MTDLMVKNDKISKDLDIYITNTSKCQEDLYQKFKEILDKPEDDQLAADFKLKLKDGSELPCHKEILSASSDFFKAMFDHNLDDAKSGQVDLSYLDGEILKKLYDFFCKGAMKLKIHEVDVKLLEAISYLQINALASIERSIDDILVHKVNDDNCITLFKLYEKAKFVKTARLAIEKIRGGKFAIMKAEFKTLSSELIELIKNCPSRKVVKKNYDKIQFSENKKEMVDVATTPDEFKSPVMTFDDFNVYILGRKPVNGYLQCIKYDLIHHDWQNLPDLPREVKQFSYPHLCVTDNKLIVVSEDPEGDEKYNLQVDVLDLETKEWTICEGLELYEFEGGNHTNCHINVIANSEKLFIILHGDNDYDEEEYTDWDDIQIEAEGIDRCHIYLYSIEKDALYLGEAYAELECDPLPNFNSPDHVHIFNDTVYAADCKLAVIGFQNEEWVWLHRPCLGLIDSCDPFSVGERLMCVMEEYDFDPDDASYSLREFNFQSGKWMNTFLPFVSAHFRMMSGGMAYTLALPKSAQGKLEDITEDLGGSDDSEDSDED